MGILGAYINGNYRVTILTDGTKIRENDLDFFEAEFPESFDMKITNQCDMGCNMCFIAGTKVLMADMTQKNIEDVRIGDEIIGFEEKASSRGAKRKIIRSKVINTFVHVESELISVNTAKCHVIATPNHPFLSEGSGANHSRIFNRIERIPVGSDLFACGFPLENIDTDSKQYTLGYIIACWAGDGSFREYTDKNGYGAYNVRFVTQDDEINDAVYERTRRFIPDVYRLAFKMSGNNGIHASVRSNKKSVYNTIVQFEHDNIGKNTSFEYYCGFLAGFCDCEGHVDNQHSIIRLSNTNVRYVNEICRCLDALQIDYAIEEKSDNNPKHKLCYIVRICGQYSASRFLWYTRPVCHRKALNNYLDMQFQYYKQKIVTKVLVEKKQYVYNLETECHTYIANNFLVHNCHEDSKPDGKHGDILHLPFLDSIHPYTELAIGGGNPLAHPDLIPFLRMLKDRNLIPNITVNKVHFLKEHDLLHHLTREKLIYGIGVSYLDAANDTNRFIEAVKRFPNAVIHIINGMISETGFRSIAGHDFKILILGYKDFRRGENNLVLHLQEIERKKTWLYNHIGDAIQNGEFKAISFDNLGISQLAPERFMTEEEWNTFYMGDDGRDGEFTSASMYIDAVEQKFARNSCCVSRYDVTSDIAEMFQFIKKGGV